jgi:hypothetical protein
VHDFVDKDLGKAIPYGVYDIAANAGCVSVGISNDTAQFVVNSIRCWLDTMGRGHYPDMNQLMIRADGGGSNGSRVRLFKLELQRLAQETGLHPVREIRGRLHLPLSRRGGSARIKGSPGGSFRGLRAGSAPSEDEARLLQGHEPAW